MHHVWFERGTLALLEKGMAFMQPSIQRQKRYIFIFRNHKTPFRPLMDNFFGAHVSHLFKCYLFTRFESCLSNFYYRCILLNSVAASFHLPLHACNRSPNERRLSIDSRAYVSSQYARWPIRTPPPTCANQDT